LCPFGNRLRLPGRHHTREHWSRVWDGGRWREGDEAIDFIVALKPCAPRPLWDAMGLDAAAGVDAIPDARVKVARAPACTTTRAACHRGAERDPAPPAVLEAAHAWAEQQPVEMQGQHGAGSSMGLLRELWSGWCLSIGQLWEVLRSWNARCQPPWPDDRLAHKINGVIRTPDPYGRPDGYLRNDYDNGRPLPRADFDKLMAGVRERARQRRQESPVPAAGGDGASAIGVREAMPDISDLIDGPPVPRRPDDEAPDPAEQSILGDPAPPCEEPPPPMPPCHRIKIRLRRGQERMVVGAPDRSWCCDVCCEWQKARWSRRIRYHLSLLDPAATVYAGYVTPGCEWGAAQRAINRAEGCYCGVLVERTRQRLLVATTPFSGAEAVTVAEAVRFVGEAIDALTTGCSVSGSESCHPVVCCRRWPEPPEMVEEEPAAGDDEPWQWDGRLSDDMDLDKAPAVLRSFGITWRDRDSGSRRFLSFEVPAGFTDDDERELWRCLESNETREQGRASDEWV
jgi:hypothetical protein